MESSDGGMQIETGSRISVGYDNRKPLPDIDEDGENLEKMLMDAGPVPSKEDIVREACRELIEKKFAYITEKHKITPFFREAYTSLEENVAAYDATLTKTSTDLKQTFKELRDNAEDAATRKIFDNYYRTAHLQLRNKTARTQYKEEQRLLNVLNATASEREVIEEAIGAEEKELYFKMLFSDKTNEILAESRKKCQSKAHIERKLYSLADAMAPVGESVRNSNYHEAVQVTLEMFGNQVAEEKTNISYETPAPYSPEKVSLILAKGPRVVVRMRGQRDEESDRTLEEEEDDEVVTYTRGKPTPVITKTKPEERDVAYDTSETVMSLKEIKGLLAEIKAQARNITPKQEGTIVNSENSFERAELDFFLNGRNCGAEYYAEQSLDERVSKQESYRPASWYHTAARYAAAVVGTVVSAGTMIGSLTVMLSGFSANLTDYAESQLHVGKYAPQAVVSTEVYHAPEQGQPTIAEKHYVPEAAHEKAKPAHAAHRKVRVETAADGSVIKNPGYKSGAYSTANAQVEIPTTEHVQYTPTISTPEIKVRRLGEVWQQEIARYQINLREAAKGKE